MLFEYAARDKTGKRVQGTLSADTERAALEQLEGRSLTPIRLTPRRVRATFSLPRRRRVGGKVMTRVYRQLSDLLRSGVSLLRSLEVLEKQSSEPHVAAALAEIRAAVADGASLAETLAKHPAMFDELGRSMIRAGEEGGFLEDALANVADYTERQEELKGKIISAAAYPVFLTVVGFIVITTLVVFFVPKFEAIFARLKAKGQLPLVTTALLETSKSLQQYGLFIVAGIAAALWGFVAWKKTPAGRQRLDRWKIAAPVWGEISRHLAIVRFSRVLGTLLTNGIPILGALRIAKDSCGNVILSQAILEAAGNVTSGASLTEPLRASGYFPRDVIERVGIAEESNNLEKVLLEIAESTERMVTRRLDLAVRLLEPILLMVMAAVTLVVVSALLLPIMRMSSALK